MFPLASCGDNEEQNQAPPASSQGSFTVKYTVDGDTWKTEKVECPSTGCPQLTVTAADFAPVRSDQACTMIFGGPERAEVEGVIDGTPVSGSFERSNGCEISRYKNVVVALLGDKAVASDAI